MEGASGFPTAISLHLPLTLRGGFRGVHHVFCLGALARVSQVACLTGTVQEGR